MNCLQNFSRISALPVDFFKGHDRKSSSFARILPVMNTTDLDSRQCVIMKAISGSQSSSKTSETEEEEKSETYSNVMTKAMGADLTYRHELGIDYNFILPDLIVGSCLQTPEDVDRLRNIGVRTIFCLQQDPDLQYFGVDINAIQEYAQKFDDIEHIRAQIRDFDGHDLRMRLPVVVSELYKAINRNGGVTYVHCTAGMGRAPAVALAYMYWVKGFRLLEAHRLMLSKRACCPKLDAIKNATADILTGLKKKPVTFKWEGQSCTLVELSGLDIGWGQKIPTKFDEEQGSWIIQRELPEGHYEYKYIVDGEWICNTSEPVTSPNKDGHVNNYVVVSADDPEIDSAKLRKRLTEDDPDLTTDERQLIRQFLEEVSTDD